MKNLAFSVGDKNIFQAMANEKPPAVTADFMRRFSQIVPAGIKRLKFPVRSLFSACIPF